MESDNLIQLIVILILLALSAYFSSAETALMAVNKIRMKALADEGDKRAGTVLRILSNQPHMLVSILIGNNIANLAASALAALLVIDLFGSRLVGIGTGVLTFLVLVFGEITPKTAASINPDKLAMAYAPSILVLTRLFTPLVLLVNAVSRGVMLLVGIDPSKKKEQITEEELRTLVDIGHEEGVIESDEKEMITNVFDFGDQSAKDIMIPRMDMTCIDVEASFAEIIEIFREDKYTRMPVFEGDTDNIIGIINIKDMLLLDRNADFQVRSFMREPFYTFELKKVSKLLNEMRKSSCNVSIIINEYGSCVGMITLEDMLEEIVGEIRDEYDEDEERNSDESVISDHEFLLDGSMRLNDVNDLLHTDLESEDYDSIGGFVTELLGHLPETGEEVTYDGLRFVVEEADETRVIKVRIFKLDTEGASVLS